MAEVEAWERRLIEQFEYEGAPPEYIFDELVSKLRATPGMKLSPVWQELFEKHRGRITRRMPPARWREYETIFRQAIHHTDEAAWDVRVSTGGRVTILLGAGASVPSGIPAVNNLLPELWSRARKVGRDDLDRLAAWCKERNVSNIEDLLTAAYIANFAAKNNATTALMDYFLFSGGRESSEDELLRRRRSGRASDVDVASISFLQETLQTLFGLLTSTMISATPNPGHRAVVEFVKQHPQTSLITTNYDGCMDEALLTSGLSLRDATGPVADGSVELLKMHGSINWASCDSCQEIKKFDLLAMKKQWENDEASFALAGMCKNCRGIRRPLLVPPLSFKFLMFPDLIDTWAQARESIKSADLLIIVGYSFSDADSYINKIVAHSMSVNKKQKMLIVNPDYKLAPVLRNKYSAHIDHFDVTRILAICGSADEALPRLLTSLLQTPPEKSALEAAEESRDKSITVV